MDIDQGNEEEEEALATKMDQSDMIVRMFCNHESLGVGSRILYHSRI
jgi:hypothetical protein